MKTWTVLFLAMLGCKDKDGGDPKPGTTTGDDACSDLSAAADESVATAVHFSWSTSTEGTATLEFGLDGALDQTASSEAQGTEHAITVPLLKSGQTYSWRGVVETSAGDTITCATQEVSIAPQPQGILGFNLNISDAERSAVAGGYVLFTTLQAQDSFVGMIDGEADYVFFKDPSREDPLFASVRARPGLDGRSIIWNVYDQDRNVDIGGLRRVDIRGGEVTSTRTLNAHHDFVELSDGEFGWLAYEFEEEVSVDGNAPAVAATACTGPGDSCPIASDMIYEGSEGMTDATAPTEVMGLLDTIDPFWACEHAEDYDGFVPDYFNLTHGNSLVYSDTEDAYYVMSRHLDAIFKIDRATGQVVWQLGGRDSQFTATGELFDHGHYSDHWPGGFLVFDNGDHRDPAVSRVAEYSYDEQAMTVELVWEVEEPTGSFIAVLGDARRLPNGNTLIDWSSKGRIQEVTPDKEVVWEAEATIGGLVSRVIFIDDFE